MLKLESLTTDDKAFTIHVITTQVEDEAKAAASAMELLDALQRVRLLISEGAVTGFNPMEGTWAHRLYESQGYTSDIVLQAGGMLRG